MGPQFNPCGRYRNGIATARYMVASMGPQFNPCGRMEWSGAGIMV